MALRINIFLFCIFLIVASTQIGICQNTNSTATKNDSLQNLYQKIDSMDLVTKRQMLETETEIRDKLNQTNSDFYNQACASLDSKHTTITIMLTIIGGLLALIAILITGGSIYFEKFIKESRQELDKEREKIFAMREKAEKELDKIVSTSSEISSLASSVSKHASKTISDAEKEKEKSASVDSELPLLASDVSKIVNETFSDVYKVIEDKKIVIQDNVIRLINKADAQKSVDEFESLLFKMQSRGIDRETLPSKLIKNVSLSYLSLEMYSKALENMNIYLESHSKDEEMLFNAGLCNGFLYDESMDIEYLNNAIKMWQKVIEINPEKDFAYVNWGVSLGRLFKNRGDISLLKDAVEKYRRAIEINPKADSVYCKMALELSRLYDMQGDVLLLEEAIEKYNKAVEINPESFTAYNNCGTDLYKLYDIRKDNSLLMDSIEKYRKAIEINPNSDYAYSNWSAALIRLYYDSKESKYLNEARDKVIKSIELSPNDKFYFFNLACAESLLENKQAMLDALKIAIDYDSKYKKMAKDDKDFEKYKNDPEFIRLSKED